MGAEVTQANSITPIYHVINKRNDQWVQISEIFSSIEEAKQAYSNLIKVYPFARLGGCNKK